MELFVGKTSKTTRILGEKEVKLFADITGDYNPIHFDEKYAEKTVFKKRIVHGVLVSGLISSVIANELPGPGSIYLSQNLKFMAPVYFDDTLTVEVEVVEVRKEKRHVLLKTEVRNQNNILVIIGESLVKYDNL